VAASRRSPGVSLWLVLAAALAPACRAERGAPFACACTWVTDFDDEARTNVEVCAADAEQSVHVARGCAQSAAPGPVQRCTCQARGDPGACALGACRVVEEP
jgi:hypothetical protein